MEITKEDVHKLDHIPTDEIKMDISDTNHEIKDFDDEREILMRNPVDNKVRIYMIEGNLLKRNEFVKKLNKILDFRNE